MRKVLPTALLLLAACSFASVRPGPELPAADYDYAALEADLRAKAAEENGPLNELLSPMQRWELERSAERAAVAENPVENAWHHTGPYVESLFSPGDGNLPFEQLAWAVWEMERAGAESGADLRLLRTRVFLYGILGKFGLQGAVGAYAQFQAREGKELSRAEIVELLAYEAEWNRRVGARFAAAALEALETKEDMLRAEVLFHILGQAVAQEDDRQVLATAREILRLTNAATPALWQLSGGLCRKHAELACVRQSIAGLEYALPSATPEDRASIEETLGQLRSAETTIEHVAEWRAEKTYDSDLAIAIALHQLDNAAEGRRLLNELAVREPDRAEAYFHLAILAMNQGDIPALATQLGALQHIESLTPEQVATVTFFATATMLHAGRESETGLKLARVAERMRGRLAGLASAESEFTNLLLDLIQDTGNGRAALHKAFAPRLAAFAARHPDSAYAWDAKAFPAVLTDAPVATLDDILTWPGTPTEEWRRLREGPQLEAALALTRKVPGTTQEGHRRIHALARERAAERQEVAFRALVSDTELLLPLEGDPARESLLDSYASLARAATASTDADLRSRLWNNTAVLLAQRGEYADARTALERARAEKDGGLVRVNRLVLTWLGGDTTGAREQYDALAAEDPKLFQREELRRLKEYFADGQPASPAPPAADVAPVFQYSTGILLALNDTNKLRVGLLPRAELFLVLLPKVP